MRSAKQQAGVISRYLQEERSHERVVDPPPMASNIQVSPFGVIPNKPHQPGKWRLILDLSSPHGRSVNDGIDPQLCSLSYARLDDAVLRILALGRGALLAKLDIQSAYRIIPVHPDDRHLLGMRWQGTICMDAALPFGLRSAPKIFTAVAGALLWIMYTNGVTWAIHYLDDFLLCGSPGSDECALNLTRALYLQRPRSPSGESQAGGADYHVSLSWYRNRYRHGPNTSPGREAEAPHRSFSYLG